MRPGRLAAVPRGARRLGVLLGALVLLGFGCAGSGSPGEDPRPESAPTTAPGSPATTPTDQAGDIESSAGRDPLADLAEGAASGLPDAPASPGETVFGGDISWPQCPRGMGIPERRTLGKPMPLDQARFVIVGLTNGPGFVANPCLADQVAWVRERDLMIAAYSVLSYPHRDQLAEHGGRGPYDSSTRTGALANVGHAQARFNIASMERAGLITPVVWLDVETVPGFDWVAQTEENAAVIRGAARGYRDAGYRVGVYSTPLLWQRIAGELTLAGAPEWRAAGPTSQAEARRRCGPDWSIQGGAAVIAQWVQDDRDLNLTCPGAEAELGALFHRYS